jgi:hypothetical protein
MSSFETPATGGRCPHFERVDDAELQRLFSKVAAIRSQNYELFSFTHRPMEVFRTNAPGSPKWSEDRVYENLTKDRLRNHAVVIEGEVGTGKSELCAYLTHKLRLDDRSIVHINKNDDLMSILSERIPEFYEEQFSEELEGAGEFRNLRNDMESVPQTVANNATTGAILNLRGAGYEGLHPNPEEEEDIRDFVAGKLDTFVNRGEFDQRIQFVSIQEYKQREELQIFSSDVTPREAVDALNEQLWSEIRSRYGTDSLDDVLERVGDRFEDERPVIVFEDFSIAAMEGEKLRNYMERDVDGDNWDFIIAGTRDATEVLHTQTAEDRFLFFQTNEADSNHVPFLTEATAVDFVRPYLGYIKSKDGSVRYNRGNDGGSFDLQSPEPGSICAGCGFCEEGFRDLFPFNAQFLERIYAGLDESQQSPREYIITVFDVLEQFHDGFIDAPSSADTLRPIQNSISVADLVYDEAEVYADLAKWYGREDGDEVVVLRQFADAFGLPTTELPDVITVMEGTVRVNSTEEAPPPPPEKECSKCGATERETRPNGDVVCASCGVAIIRGADPIQQKIEKAKREIDAWVEDPTHFKQTDVYIRRGLRDLLEELTDGYALHEGAPLEYNLSSQKEPFVYPDAGEAPDGDQFVLDRAEFNRSDLRSLVEFGVYREERPRSADYEAQFERIGTQLTGYAQKWRQTVMEHNLANREALYKRHARYDFTDFVLASYAALCLLDDPWEPVTAERLNEQYAADTSLKLDRNVRQALEDIIPPEDFGYLETVIEQGEYIESLVGELLGVSASTLDVPKVRHRLETNPPYQVLSMLGRGQIQTIDSRVRFDTHHSVKNFADTMYDVRKALNDVGEHGYNGDVVTYSTDVLAGTDLQEVNELYDRMQTYDHIESELLETLGKVCSHEQEELDQVISAAELAAEMSQAEDWQRIHGALASRKLAETPLVEQFRSVPLQGGGTGGELGAAFKKVMRYYVD